jgi:hypothetical protein
MSNAASHAHAFYRQVAQEKKVWTVKDSGGFPAPMNSEGKRAQPFWSSLSRVELIKKNVPAYAAFEPHEISWEAFRDRWLPGLKKDGILIGVNWSGDRSKGYDIESDFVRDAIEIQLKNQQCEQDGGGQAATRSESK